MDSELSKYLNHRIHIIGSEGFIGKAIQRNACNSDIKCWSHKEKGGDFYFNLLEEESWSNLIDSNPQNIIFLSWPGLPNYNKSFHLTQNLILYIRLLERLINTGTKKVVFAGTCYEYGLQNGQLKEDQLTDPINLYAIAKDCLRRTVRNICESSGVDWCWVRIFYPYGEGQNPNSILPSLEESIKKKKPFFEMSSGKQIRDFISVDEVAKDLLKLAKSSKAYGIYNSGSGKPISLIELVQKKITESNSDISIKRGVFPDRDDEPIAFWGDISKINKL